MRIYTRAGDDGTTQLLGAGRVSKAEARVVACGGVDELNAALGVILVEPLDEDVRTELGQVQADLFTVGAELATPPGQASAALPRVPAGWAARVEGWIDRHEAALPPLHAFILPGGGRTAALAHLARAVCRRAERDVVRLSRREPVGEPLLGYLNRLSDYLFVLARTMNARTGLAEVPWVAPRMDAP